jgi:hypothetical protein
MPEVRVDADGKATVDGRTLTFPLSLAGATVTVPDVEPESVPDDAAEPFEDG